MGICSSSSNTRNNHLVLTLEQARQDIEKLFELEDFKAVEIAYVTPGSEEYYTTSILHTKNYGSRLNKHGWNAQKIDLVERVSIDIRAHVPVSRASSHVTRYMWWLNLQGDEKTCPIILGLIRYDPIQQPIGSFVSLQSHLVYKRDSEDEGYEDRHVRGGDDGRGGEEKK